MKENNFQELQTFLKRLQKNIENTKPMMHTIGEKVINSAMEAFEKERDPITGKPWSPISSNTLFTQTGGKRKSNIKSGKQHTKEFMRKLNDKRILQFKGDLIKNIDYTANKSEVIITAGTPYAATHQFGDKKRNIKQRRFLPFTDTLELDSKVQKEVMEELSEFIFED